MIEPITDTPYISTSNVQTYKQTIVKVYGDQVVTITDQFTLYNRTGTIQTVKHVFGSVDILA